MNRSIFKASKEEQEEVIKKYQNGVSMRQIEKDLEINRSTISRFLEINGIKTTKGNHYRIYYHNEDFFEKIDTDEKAYFLGWMFADGYIVDYSEKYGQDQFGISLAEQDIELLENFKTAINSTNPIKIYDSRKLNEQKMARLLMTSQKTVDDLIDKGCVKQKTSILEPPKNLPREFYAAFTRGYFEGDGCITSTLQGNYQNFHFQVVGTLEMMTWFQEIWGIGSVSKENRNEKVYYWRFGGNQQVNNFGQIIYDNPSYYLSRKKKKFDSLKEILGN